MLESSPQTAAQALFSARRLVRCDYPVEQFLRALHSRPAAAFSALRAVVFTGASLEDAIAAKVNVTADHLLLDGEAVEQIRTARAAGLQPMLISDMPEAWTKALAGHLDVGVAEVDPSLSARVETPPFSSAGTSLGKSLFRLLRIHQWPKNALVFLPVLLAHRFTDISLVTASIVAFFAFGLAASTIYVLNDMMDIASDRKHPSKRFRPIASGAIPARWGVFIALACLAGAIGATMTLPPVFALAIGAYIIVNLIYTFYLKRKLLVDVLALAGSYTLRIIAGNAATGLALSFWLLAFSVFLFFSLALVKRYVEMDTIGVSHRQERRVMGRGYRYVDLEMLSQMGVASAFAAVLVLALYVERAGSTGLYTHPELIWIICPIVLYVISRIWFLAKRGEMKDDPVSFILHDWRSHLMGLIVLAIMVAASW